MKNNISGYKEKTSVKDGGEAVYKRRGGQSCSYFIITRFRLGQHDDILIFKTQVVLAHLVKTLNDLAGFALQLNTTIFWASTSNLRHPFINVLFIADCNKLYLYLVVNSIRHRCHVQKVHAITTLGHLITFIDYYFYTILITKIFVCYLASGRC